MSQTKSGDTKTKDSEEWHISVCGLNCAKCDIYEAGHRKKNCEMK